MSKYRVQHTYRGVVDHTYTVLEAGSEVELDDATAAWIERDSPGALRQAKSAKGQAKGSHDRSAS